ncbi:MAG: hypothetical protein ACP5MD_15325 [Verrucomicrobiia bacterium]
MATLHALPGENSEWRIGKPIVTYWAGPAMTDATARQMVEGGFNLVWCTEKELDVAQRHGLRALLHDSSISPVSLDAPEQREKLEALIKRVRSHPAMYAYFITDEPSAAAFPGLGKLVAFLRDHDPSHMAYINLFPTYANNEQLGTKGDVVTAYAEHLNRFVAEVKPALLSYDHYQFKVQGDGDQYFLNLAMIRRVAQQANVPFLNIVQACSWTPSMRVPNPDEVRYLVYTTAAYGAQGISYYVYCHPGHTGGIALPDGTPTPLYHALKTLNRQFASIAGQLQNLDSIGVYHTSFKEQGCEPVPENSAFKVESKAGGPNGDRGFLLGLLGRANKPSHVVVVNLDYRSKKTATLVGPANMEKFDADAERWEPGNGRRAELALEPGAGALLRVKL